jgi:hypothetical protein
VRDAGGSGDLAGDRGQALTAPQGLGAQHMLGKVAVAKGKPIRSAELAQAIHEVPGLALDPPSPLTVAQPGERVSNRVDIGANGKAKLFEVAAGVDCDQQVGGRKDL